MTLGIFSSDFGRSSSKRFPTKWLFPAVTSPIQTVIVKLLSAWPSRRRAARESAANVLKPFVIWRQGDVPSPGPSRLLTSPSAVKRRCLSSLLFGPAAANVTQHHRNQKLLIRMQHSQHRKDLTISTTVRNYRRILEAETAKQVLFTCPSEIIFWQLTGSGEDIEDFLGRKLSELESSFLCEQCWDILLGFHEIGLAKRDIPGIFNSPWKWVIFDHLFRHSKVVVLKAARNGHLFR